MDKCILSHSKEPTAGPCALTSGGRSLSYCKVDSIFRFPRIVSHDENHSITKTL